MMTQNQGSDQQTLSTEAERSSRPSGTCSIKDLDSFNAVTGENHEIAGLYFYYMLDHVIDITHAVADDFATQRFHLFTNNEPDNALALLKLYTRLGHDEIFLSREHRHLIWRALFGHPTNGLMNDNYNFPELRDKLFETASEFVNRAEIDTGAPALILAFRDALIPFNQYISAVQGGAAKFYRNTSLPELTEGNVYSILRNREVTAVYGINTPIRSEWPYAFDTNANKVIEEISYQLMVKNDQGKYYTQKLESYLETDAKRGACAIAAALDTDPEDSSDEDIVQLINKVHAWHTACQFLKDYAMPGSPPLPGNAGNGTPPPQEGQPTVNSRSMSSAMYRR